MTYRKSSVSIDSLDASETSEHGLIQEEISLPGFIINSQIGCDSRESSNGGILDKQKWMTKKFNEKEKWEANISKESINISVSDTFNMTGAGGKMERLTEINNSSKAGHLKPPLPKGKVEKENTVTASHQPENNKEPLSPLSVARPETKVKDNQVSGIKISMASNSSIFGQNTGLGAANDSRDTHPIEQMKYHGQSLPHELDIKCKIKIDSPNVSTKLLDFYSLSRENGDALNKNINEYLEEGIGESGISSNIQIPDSTSYSRADTISSKGQMVFHAHNNSSYPKFNKISQEEDKGKADVNRSCFHHVANLPNTNPTIGAVGGSHDSLNQRSYYSLNTDFPTIPKATSIPSAREAIFHRSINDNPKTPVPYSLSQDVNDSMKEIHSCSIRKETVNHNLQMRPAEIKIMQERAITSTGMKAANQEIISKYESIYPTQQELQIDEQYSDSVSSGDESCEELERRINVLLSSISDTSLLEENKIMQVDKDEIENEPKGDGFERYEFYLKNNCRKAPLFENRAAQVLENDQLEDQVKSREINTLSNIKFPSASPFVPRVNNSEFENYEMTKEISSPSQKSKLHQSNAQKRSCDRKNSFMKNEYEPSSIESVVEKRQAGDGIKCNGDIEKEEPQYNLEKILDPQLLFLPANIQKYISKYATKTAAEDKIMNTKELMSEPTQHTRYPKRNVNAPSMMRIEPSYDEELSPDIKSRDSEYKGNIFPRSCRKKRKSILSNEYKNNMEHQFQIPLSFREKSKHFSATDTRFNRIQQNQYGIKGDTSSSKSEKEIYRFPIQTRNYAYKKNLSWMRAFAPTAQGKKEIRNDMVLRKCRHEVNLEGNYCGMNNNYWQKMDQITNLCPEVTTAPKENDNMKWNGLTQNIKADPSHKIILGNHEKTPSLQNWTSPFFFKIEDVIVQQALMGLLSPGDDDDDDDSDHSQLTDEEKNTANMTKQSSFDEQGPRESIKSLDTLEEENNPYDARGSLKENVKQDREANHSQTMENEPTTNDNLSFEKSESKDEEVLMQEAHQGDRISQEETGSESKTLCIKQDSSDEKNLKMQSGSESDSHLDATENESTSIDLKSSSNDENLPQDESGDGEARSLHETVTHSHTRPSEEIHDNDRTLSTRPSVPNENSEESLSRNDTELQNSLDISSTLPDVESEKSKEATTAKMNNLDRKLESIDEENTISSEESLHRTSLSGDLGIEDNNVQYPKTDESQEKHEQETANSVEVPAEPQDRFSSISHELVNGPEGPPNISLADSGSNTESVISTQPLTSTMENNCSDEKSSALLTVEGSMLKNKFLPFFEIREALEKTLSTKEKCVETEDDKKSKQKEKKRKLKKEKETDTLAMKHSNHIGKNDSKISTESPTTESNINDRDARESEISKEPNDGDDERIFQDENGDWIVIFL